jgi:hypothetical protein
MFYTCNRILPGESRYGGSKVILKSMSLVKLTKLKDQVDAILHTKVTDQRRSLEAQLTNSPDFRAPNYAPKGEVSAALSSRNTAIRKIRAKPGPDED